jgi:hypothetical protein
VVKGSVVREVGLDDDEEKEGLEEEKPFPRESDLEAFVERSSIDVAAAVCPCPEREFLPRPMPPYEVVVMLGTDDEAKGVDSDRSRGGGFDDATEEGRVAGAGKEVERSMSLPRAAEMAEKSNPAFGGRVESGSSRSALPASGGADLVLDGEVGGAVALAWPSSLGGRSSSPSSYSGTLPEGARVSELLALREEGEEEAGEGFLLEEVERENQRFDFFSLRAASSSSVMTIRSSKNSGSYSPRNEEARWAWWTLRKEKRRRRTHLGLVKVIGRDLVRGHKERSQSKSQDRAQRHGRDVYRQPNGM